jgi:hypothetical protein
MLPASFEHRSRYSYEGRLTDPTTDHPHYIRFDASFDAIRKALEHAV